MSIKLNTEKRDKVIVMSDLHLGEEESVLNNGDLGAKDFKYINGEFYNNRLTSIEDLKETRKKNIDSLRNELIKLGQIDELILLGDVFDFSLASLHEAYDNAREFFGILLADSSPPSIKEITYIAGNHDHHLWLQIFEHYVVTDNIKNPPDRNQYLSWFVDQDITPPLPADLRKTFLNDLLPVGSKTTINVRYPHVMREVGNKNYYFTHGHYLQKVFRPVGQIIRPHNLGELEAFNSLWLEAVWYHLGQAGRLSFLVERIYEPRKDDKVFWKELDRVVTDILSRFSPPSYLLKPISRIAKWSIKKWLMSYLRKRINRNHKSFLRETLSSSLRGRDTETMVREVQNYLKEDLLQFVDLPHPFTFIYGHTHKTTGLNTGRTVAEVGGEQYPVENTGAWLEEKGEKKNSGFFVIDDKGLRWVHIPIA